MKFKELREADLSKAQIKKVHDKADDLPKNDFIKRYGKEGDAVRFATATKMVKKELGIDEGTWHIAKNMTKLKNTMKQPMPLGKGSFDFVADFIGDDELWDDFQALKTGQDMRPAIKKAMKRLGIKEEFEEGRIMGISRLNPSYKEGEKAAEKGIKYDKNPYSQSTPGFKRLNWSSGHNAFRANQLSKAGKPNYGARGQFEELDDKDKETIKPIIKQLQKSVKAHGKQAKQLQKDIKDEVEITEAVSDAYVKQIARMTDRNDHFGARIELARMMKDKELMQMYDSLEKMHRMNLGGNDALTLRSKLDKNLKFRLTQKVKKDADRLMDAL